MGDETRASEQKGVMRWTGIKLWTSDQRDGKLQKFQHAHWLKAAQSLTFFVCKKLKLSVES